MKDAKSFEEWEAAAIVFDEIKGHDIWRQDPVSRHYDHRLISARLRAILNAREDVSVLPLIGHLRSGLVRNLGNVTSPRLFNRAYAGTKTPIEEYVTQVCMSIEHVATVPANVALADRGLGLSHQSKLDLFHDTRQAFGRSALIVLAKTPDEDFGFYPDIGPRLWQMGVVRALHLRGLLPTVITGQYSAAYVAAIICASVEKELLHNLSSDLLDFVTHAPGAMREHKMRREDDSSMICGVRKRHNLRMEDALLELRILQQHVRDVVGNMTFSEAYARTKRVLNIVVPVLEGSKIPCLLNYLTAPDVV